MKKEIEKIIKKIQLKKRIYEEEVRENNIEPASIEGEFHDQFIQGYNQAVKDLDEKIKQL